MKIKFYLFIFLIVLFSCQLVSAQMISLSIPKTEYTFHEFVLVDVNLNAENYDIIGGLKITSSIRSEYFESEYFLEQISLRKGETVNLTFGFYVPEVIAEGEYNITAELIDSIGNVMFSQRVFFDIAQGINVFSFDIALNKKVFLQNEEINIDYISSVENPAINATLTYPDGTTESIALPKTLTASQIGTYNLGVSASKEGYRDVSLNEQFGVIEGDVIIREIKPESLYRTSEEKIKDLGWIFWVIVGVIILLILIVVLLIIRFIRRRREELQEPQKSQELQGLQKPQKPQFS